MTVTLLLGVRAIYYRALVDNRVRMWKRHGDIYIYIYTGRGGAHVSHSY